MERTRWQGLAAGLSWQQQQQQQQQQQPPEAHYIPTTRTMPPASMTSTAGTAQPHSLRGIPLVSSITQQQQPQAGAPVVGYASSRQVEEDYAEGRQGVNDADSFLKQEMECVVCLAAPKETCCIPCGHVCMVSVSRSCIHN